MKVVVNEKTSIKVEIEFESLEDFFTEMMLMSANTGNSKIYSELWDFIYQDRQDYVDSYEAFKKLVEVKK